MAECNTEDDSDIDSNDATDDTGKLFNPAKGTTCVKDCYDAE